MSLKILDRTNPGRMTGVLRYLTGALIISPAVGGLIGGILGGIGFVTGYRVKVFSQEAVQTFIFGFKEGAGFGVLTGLLFGLFATWFVRKESVWRAIKFIGGITLIFAAPLALIGLAPMAWFAGMFGFWCGFAWLLTKNETQRIKFEMTKTISSREA